MMGKPKKKKVEIEENEFLKGLIDEVKAYDENAPVEINDESLVSFEHVDPASDYDSKDRSSEVYESTKLGGGSSEDVDVPTAFAKLGKSLEEEKANAAAKAYEIPPTPNEKTIATPETSTRTVATNQESDRTVAVEGARGAYSQKPVLQEKVVSGSLKGTRSGQVYTSLDASLAQAETLKLAQERIKELEHECDRLRQENDDLSSASEVVTRRMEEMQARVMKLQKEKTENSEQAKSEQLILKGHLQYKDSELSKAKTKIEELESRLKTDFRKIRVRERELENRLELVRAEKQALMRSKDEKILDLQRKLDQFKSELDLYRSKVQDLNKSMEEQQEQMKKTVRALRVAMSNLEHDEDEDPNKQNVG